MQSQAAAAAARGLEINFLSAADTLAARARACSEAESYIYVARFTFDQPGAVAYLKAARARGPSFASCSAATTKA